MPQKEVVEWLTAKTRLNDAEERLKAQVRNVERLTRLRFIRMLGAPQE
jgi:hypothetical protein